MKNQWHMDLKKKVHYQKGGKLHNNNLLFSKERVILICMLP